MGGLVRFHRLGFWFYESVRSMAVVVCWGGSDKWRSHGCFSPQWQVKKRVRTMGPYLYSNESHDLDGIAHSLTS